MKLGPVTKRDKRNKATSNKFDEDVTESAKVMLSLILTFCLTKTKSRTKKSLTQVSHYCFE